MAAILNGFLPAKKKEIRYSHLNTRWGDAAISSPMHGGWNNSGAPTRIQANTSPDLDRDLPPTPPQHDGGIDGVFIVHDEEESNQSGVGSIEGPDRDNIALSVSLPAWKRKASHHRNHSQPSDSVLNPKFTPSRRADKVSSLSTADAAATVSSPESRVNSPILRTTPVLSFRNRFANSNLTDMLSPVVEGFAKNGPSTRLAPIASSTDGVAEPIERASSGSSPKSNVSRRSSITATNNSEGLGGMTMTSQVASDGKVPVTDRPQSRGIGSTARMRASSREPRVSSRGQQPASVEPCSQRSGSVESVAWRIPSVDPVFKRALSIESISYRSTSIEPRTRRAPSMEPIASRGQSVDHYSRRGQSLEPFIHRRRRADPDSHQDEANMLPVIPAVLDLEPLRKRAPSIEPSRRRAPSTNPADRRGTSSGLAFRRGNSVEPITGRAISRGPTVGLGRTQSREPRGRRGASVEPNPRVRFHSEVAPRTNRHNSFSSNDGSLESDEEKEDFDSRHFCPPSRVNPDFTSTRKPRRRRSIASPIASPTAASFNKHRNKEPHALPPLTANLDSISSRADNTRSIVTPVERKPASREQSQTRTRGVYADLQDDFSMLAREVQTNGRKAAPTTEPSTLYPHLPKTVFDPPSLVTQLPRNILNSSSKTMSPIVGSNPSVYQAGIGTLVNSQWDGEWTGDTTSNSNDYSDSSQLSLPPTSQSNETSSDNGRPSPNDDAGVRAVLASITRDRHDQLRREEREKAREKVTRRLERERERVLAINAANMGMSDCESGRDDRTRRVYGSNVSPTLNNEVEGRREEEKILVPDDDIIWG